MASISSILPPMGCETFHASASGPSLSFLSVLFFRVRMGVPASTFACACTKAVPLRTASLCFNFDFLGVDLPKSLASRFLLIAAKASSWVERGVSKLNYKSLVHRLKATRTYLEYYWSHCGKGEMREACRLQGHLNARSLSLQSAGRKTFQKNNWSQVGDRLIALHRAAEVGQVLHSDFMVFAIA